MFEHDLGYEDHIILYERSPSIWAPRVWWILTSYGFNNVKLLDCYLDHWESLGLPVQEGLFKKKQKGNKKRYSINLILIQQCGSQSGRFKMA